MRLIGKRMPTPGDRCPLCRLERRPRPLEIHNPTRALDGSVGGRNLETIDLAGSKDLLPIWDHSDFQGVLPASSLHAGIVTRDSLDDRVFVLC